MHQYTQSVRLIQARNPHVYDVALDLGHQTRYIGKLDKSGEGTFSAKRNEKHLHRKTNSLGINLELLQRFDFKSIVIEYVGNKLVSTRSFILYHGSVLDFSKSGFEKQVFLKLDLWGRERAEAFERTLGQQGDLFSGQAA